MEIINNAYVIILAAGKAKRLSPLNNQIPKPLINAINESILSESRVKGIEIIDHDVINENVGRYHITYLSDIEKMNEIFREIEKRKKIKKSDSIK